MKIALFTSNRTTVPPEKDIVAASATLTAILADRLVELGHDVTLYAPRGSVSKAKIIDLGMEPPRLDYALQKEDWVKNLALGMKQRYLSEVFKDSHLYDIIHLQTEPVYLGMPFAQLTSTPVVVTNHNVFIPQEAPLLREYKHIPIITISDYQRTIIPDLNYVSTVYNGIDVSEFPFNETSDDYMYHIGRLVKSKGVVEAVQVAKEVQRRFIIAGKGTDDFIDAEIKPHLSQHIEYKGMLGRQSNEWFDMYARAKLFLLPIQWDEPFGLVMIEAMATGTPVVAFARGAVPEVVKDGVTGYIVNPSDDDIRGDFIVKKTGLAGIKEAVERIYALAPDHYAKMRKNSRKHVEENFSEEKMVEGYIRVYTNILKGN